MKVRLCSAALVFVMLFSMFSFPAAASGDELYIGNEIGQGVSDAPEYEYEYAPVTVERVSYSKRESLPEMTIGQMPALTAVGAEAEPYIDHENWHDVSDTEIDSMYNNGDSFVVMLYYNTSSKRKSNVEEWLAKYDDLTVYGVEQNAYDIPSWVWRSLNASSVYLPVICVVEDGDVSSFTPDDDVYSIEERICEYLGVEGPAEDPDKVPYIDHENWQDVSLSYVNSMYNNGDPFVALFYRNNNAGSSLRKVMVKGWMEDYDLTVYGVDIDRYTIPSWVWAKIDGSSVSLPVICIVEDGDASVFTPDDSMESLQTRLYEFLGLEDTGDAGFSRIDHLIFDNYSTRYTKYLGNASAVSSDIAAKARTVVGGIDDDLDRLAAIYDWVADNIYYNHDIAAGTASRHDSAEETFRIGDSVCSGYANLTKAMCQAVGIPCRVVTGFATGVGSYESTNTVWGLYKTYLSGGNFDQFVTDARQYSNHAWNEAFVDGRWVILDTTWGSNNKYSPSTGERVKGGSDRDYFDPDLDRFAETHLFFDKHEDMSYQRMSNDSLHVTGEVDSGDVSGSTKIIAVYNARGKMIRCEEIVLNGKTFDVTLDNCGSAVKIKLFTPKSGIVPASLPYTAFIGAAA